MENLETGTIKVPTEYFFKMAKADYYSYRQALAREFYQNSVDAGATLIEVEVDQENGLVEVSDNGCGMDYSTIRDKLLVLGGSKKAEGSAGAFGKAKEILFFSWKSYEIRTRDLLVTGSGAEYTIQRVDGYQEGVICLITLWKEESPQRILDSFKTVATAFEVKCQIKVNGSFVTSTAVKGELVRTSPIGNLYFNKNSKYGYVRTRIKGQWMFDSYVHALWDLGTAIFEVNGDSVQCFTSNRDSLKGEYKSMLDKLLSEFATDIITLLRPIPVVIQEKISGNGAIKLDALGRKVAEALHATTDTESLGDHLYDIFFNSPQYVVARIAEVVKSRDPWAHKDRIAFMGFEPDFHLKYPKEIQSKVTRFMGTSKAIRIAKIWAEFLKQVFLDLERYPTFHVGFTYGDDYAQFGAVEDIPCFYLNPERILRRAGKENAIFKDKESLLEDLKQCAVHEITHYTTEENSHNQQFVAAMEDNTAKTWKSRRLYMAVIKEIARN